MSSSQNQDLDLECQRIIKPKKFNAKLIGSLDTDENSMQTDDTSQFFKRTDLKTKKSKKFEDENSKNSSNKYARRLPIAFNILNQGMASITSKIKTNNQELQIKHVQKNGSTNPSVQKNALKHLISKKFQQDSYKLGKNDQGSEETSQKNQRMQFTQSYHHTNEKKYFNSQTQINQSIIGQKTMPIFGHSHRNRTQIIKQLSVGSNKIRTNWHKGLINGYTQIDYEDKGKFRGIFQQGQMASGQMTFSNGFIYTGEFSFYKFHGFGKLKFPSGQVFQGNWFFGSLNGKAKIFYPQGQFYYGQVSNFKRNGQGYLYFKNGDKYVGQFYEGEIMGFGQLHKNGVCTHKGFWIDGKFIGDQQQIYLEKKQECQKKKVNKNQQSSRISFDIQTSLNQIRSINQAIKNNHENQIFEFKPKLCVSFNENLNQQFMQHTKQTQKQQKWLKMGQHSDFTFKSL